MSSAKEDNDSMIPSEAFGLDSIIPKRLTRSSVRILFLYFEASSLVVFRSIIKVVQLIRALGSITNAANSGFRINGKCS